MANQRSSTQIKIKMLSYIVSDLRCIWHRQFVAHRSLPPARRRFNGVVQQVTPADIVSIIMLTNRLAESNNYHQYCMQIACKYASVYIYQQVWPLLFSCLVDSPKTLTTPGQQPLTKSPIAQTICMPGLAELQDFVESNSVHAAENQQTNYNRQSCSKTIYTSSMEWM